MKNAEYMKALGRAIRDIRKSKGLTVSDLHYDARMSRQSVLKIERGEKTPRLDSIIVICKALEVKPSTLFAMADSKQ